MKILTLIALFISAFLFTSISEAKPVTGVSSYYHPNLDGRLTANGERYNHKTLTAAHRSLPFGTVVKVTDLLTKKSVVVKINDRGPFVKGRIIDLSGAAADTLGIKDKGVANVKLTVLSKPSKSDKAEPSIHVVKSEPATVEKRTFKPYDTIETFITMLDEKEPKLYAMSL